MDADARRALDGETYTSLTTFRKTGRAVPTPVWFALAGEHFYVFSEASAGKMKRLRNDSRIEFAACNARGKVHGEAYAGRGVRVEDPAVIETAYDALRAKYGWQMHLGDFFSRLTGRYDNRAFIEIELEGPVQAR